MEMRRLETIQSVYAQDTNRFTIMSYYDETEDGSDSWYGAAPPRPCCTTCWRSRTSTARTLTRATSNTVYGFNSTADRDVFDFTINDSPYLPSMTPAGSTRSTPPASTTLRPSTSGSTGSDSRSTQKRFSSIGGLVNSVAIAYGVKSRTPRAAVARTPSRATPPSTSSRAGLTTTPSTAWPVATR